MLGSDLALACRQHQFTTTILDLPDFDITNYQQLDRAVRNTSVVVNCAAYTDVDDAESHAEMAYKVNAEAVGRLASIAKDAGVWVLHIGTDFVFDGKSDRPYAETDAPNPINTYGKSKLAGEQLLVESRCRYCIMRIEWTYGLGGGNFVTRLIETAKADKKLKVVDDQVGSPTATTEVAGVICKLLQKKPEGLFHFAAAGYVSRFEMAKFVFDRLNMSVDLSSCKSAEPANLPAATPRVARHGGRAARLLNSLFDCSKIKALLDEPIKPWQEPLERFLLSEPRP